MQLKPNFVHNVVKIYLLELQFIILIINHTGKRFRHAILGSEVAKEIGQLKVTKSGGYDEMSPKVIRGISNHIVYTINHFLLALFQMN